MKIIKILIFCAFSLTLINCGDSEKKEEKTEVKLRSNSSEEKKADPNVTEVTLLATDLMQYDTNEIRVPAGKKVRLTLKHTGKLDMKVMGHNFVLLAQGTEIPVFANKASAATENQYIPEGTDEVIANTKMLGGGQSDIIEFDAPESGTYDFICSFPGHYSLMKGKFIVE